jgi:predicted ester cyclase
MPSAVLAPVQKNSVIARWQGRSMALHWCHRQFFNGSAKMRGGRTIMSSSTSLSTDTMTQLARRFIMEHNQADYLASHDALMTPDAIVHEYLPGLPTALDRAGYTHFIAMFRSALPDITNTAEDVIVAGDKVAVRWTGSGTHTGEPLMNQAATGRPVQAHGIYILRFDGDKIAEVWNHWDNLSVLTQLSAPGA